MRRITDNVAELPNGACIVIFQLEPDQTAYSCPFCKMKHPVIGNGLQDAQCLVTITRFSDGYKVSNADGVWIERPK